MNFSKHYLFLTECGFRELGYFSGMNVYMGMDTLITIAEQGGGYLVTVDSIARNIGMVEYVCNSIQLVQFLQEVIA